MMKNATPLAGFNKILQIS